MRRDAGYPRASADPATDRERSSGCREDNHHPPLYPGSHVGIGSAGIAPSPSLPGRNYLLRTGVISPLLSNLVLDELDRELERRGHRFARYADDFNIYIRTKRAGQRVMESITRVITQRLKLKVNEAKSAVARPQERKLLGFGFTAGPEVKRTITPKALDRFKARLREITRRTKGVNIETTVKALASLGPTLARNTAASYAVPGPPVRTRHCISAYRMLTFARSAFPRLPRRLAWPHESPGSNPSARWCVRDQGATVPLCRSSYLYVPRISIYMSVSTSGRAAAHFRRVRCAGGASNLHCWRHYFISVTSFIFGLAC
jgi:hypothetical protein